MHPLLLTLIITALLVVLLPPFFRKHTLEIVQHLDHVKHRIFFHDIDHDGIDEQIVLNFELGKKLPNLQLKRNFQLPNVYRHVIQVNLNRDYTHNQFPFFGDFDGDNKDETYIFLNSADSLFLYGFTLQVNSPFLARYIDNVCFISDTIPDFTLVNPQFCDMDGDGYHEILFAIKGGFCEKPRALYSLNIKTGILTRKDVRFANIKLVDNSIVNGIEHGPVLATSSSASQNVPDTSSRYFSDYFTWLMVFDSTLNYIFPPVKHQADSIKTGIDAFPLICSDLNTYVYAYFKNYSPEKVNTLRKYALNGKVADSLKIGHGELTKLCLVKDSAESYFLLLDSFREIVFVLDENLMIREQYAPSKQYGYTGEWFFMDIDRDGKSELLQLNSKGKQFVIYEKSFRYPVAVDMPFYCGGDFYITTCNLKNQDANIFMQSGSNTLYFNYKSNPYYYLKFPFYLAMYILISLFFHFIFHIQKRNLMKKYEQEKYMSELELLTIKNQIDPHFTFNAINTLSGVIFEKDQKTAHRFLVELSSVIRSTLTNSKNISVKLEEELDFVKNYLNIQKLRHNDKFEFTINTETGIEMDAVVPKMIIQTFAENAVKHGLVHKDGAGTLIIEVQRCKAGLEITIEDDGIGRKKATEVSTGSTGRGHEIIARIIELYNKLKKTDVSYRIVDKLTKNGDSAGTRVEILIPESLTSSANSL